MLDDVDTDAVAQFVADVLLRESAAWFKKLRPMDKRGRLRLPIQYDSEWFRGPFVGGAGISPANHLVQIMETRRRLLAERAPASRALSSTIAFCAELQTLSPDTPVADMSILRGLGVFVKRERPIATVYADVKSERVIGFFDWMEVKLD